MKNTHGNFKPCICKDFILFSRYLFSICSKGDFDLLTQVDKMIKSGSDFCHLK
jgi:hypothetical protein